MREVGHRRAPRTAEKIFACTDPLSERTGRHIVRILLYTGKGGVGKTTIAAASALRMAELGHRTVILSTDAAHSLADAFEHPLGPLPTPIVENLWGQEVSILHAIETHWGTIQRWLAALMAWRGVQGVAAEEMAILPGMEEMASLLYIVQHYDEGAYDTIVVDCAPTADTLRLLAFPEVLRWWMEHLFPIHRRVTLTVAPLVRALWDLPMPTEEVYNAIEDLFYRLDRMHSLLTNPALTSARLVLNPEKMVIREAQRTHTYLGLYGHQTDLIICNRVLPKAESEDYFSAWRETQARYIAQVQEAFAPLPIRMVPFFEQEVVGLPMLRRMGEALFGDEDPAAFFYRGRAETIERLDGEAGEDDGYVLTLTLPFVTKDQVIVNQVGDELAIEIGNFRRTIILPRALAGLSPTEAKLDGDLLRVRFRSAPR